MAHEIFLYIYSIKNLQYIYDYLLYLHLTLPCYEDDTPRSKIFCLPRGHKHKKRLVKRQTELQAKDSCNQIIASEDWERLEPLKAV